MIRRALPIGLLVAACGGGATLFEGEMAAATFVVVMSPFEVTVTGSDRFAVGAGDEDRLDVLQLAESASIRPIYAATPTPEPFEFVRDPLAAGPIAPVLASADQLVAVLYPLVDPTPGGRVLSGALIALGGDGALLGTDWGEVADARMTELLAWAADRGIEPGRAVELAVRGLGGDDSSDAREAASFIR